MISREAIEVFAQYRGALDALARTGTGTQKHMLSGGVAMEISNLLLRLSLVQSGTASASFAAETSTLLHSLVSEPAAMVLLKSLAGTMHVS